MKTHSSAPEYLPDDVKAVFLFGDPLHAIVSTREKRFDANHFANCGYTSDVPPDIYKEDALEYERNFDSWMTAHDYPVLVVRYETMFDNQNTLSEYLKFRVKLPPRRGRTNRISPELSERLSTVYGSLIRKVHAAPDIALLSNPKG